MYYQPESWCLTGYCSYLQLVLVVWTWKFDPTAKHSQIKYWKAFYQIQINWIPWDVFLDIQSLKNTQNTYLAQCGTFSELWWGARSEKSWSWALFKPCHTGLKKYCMMHGAMHQHLFDFPDDSNKMCWTDRNKLKKASIFIEWFFWNLTKIQYL